MKKYSMIALCTLAMVSAPAVLLAAVSTVTVTAPTIANNGANTKGPATMTFTPSPNVTLSVYSTINGYGITAANILTDTTNGLEYGALHTSTGYAQRTKTTAAQSGPAAATSVTALPDAGWIWMGGSGT